jgi:VWFA-related protein
LVGTSLPHAFLTGKTMDRRVFRIASWTHLRALCLVLLLSAFAGFEALRPARAQDATTMSVKVNVVNVLATVRDKHGQIVNDLSKDDFDLTEEGRPQTIRYFTKETDLALTLGLLVDTSFSQKRVLDQERTASQSFLNEIVRDDKDKAFLIHFDRQVELLQDLTSSHDELQAALAQMEAPQLERTNGGNSPDADPDSGRGSGRHWGGGGTLLYDAVYLASNELMSKQTGRKALVILSDGVDRGSKESLETAIATAQKADTMVYSILFKDDEQEHRNHRGFGGPRIGMGGPGIGGPGMGGPMGGGGIGRRGGGYPSPEERPDGKKILERISKETGGRLFEVSKKQPIGDIYTAMAEDLRNQYSLGYTPDRVGAAGEYHKIVLTARKKDLVVQARDGYYSQQ